MSHFSYTASVSDVPGTPARAFAAAAPQGSSAGAPARGVFISFEGGDGAGKSTHLRFLAGVLEAAGREVVCLREPGGTSVGEQLRGVVLNPGNESICDASELLLYEAARAQLVSEVVAPALARGAVVLCDRFYDSTVAYQGFGRGLDRAFIDAANAFACQGVAPDRTIMLVAPSADIGLERATRHVGADRMERAGVEFHARVNAAFLEIAKSDRRRIRVVSSAGSKSATARAILAELADLFPWMEAFSAQNAEYFDRLDVQRSHEGRIQLRGDDNARPLAPSSGREGAPEGQR